MQHDKPSLSVYIVEYGEHQELKYINVMGDTTASIVFNRGDFFADFIEFILEHFQKEINNEIKTTGGIKYRNVNDVEISVDYQFIDEFVRRLNEVVINLEYENKNLE